MSRCDRCGRFMPHDTQEGSSWLFVPDTPFTHEELALWCRDCTNMNGGPPLPQQSVDVSKCCGVNRGGDPEAKDHNPWTLTREQG